MNHRLARAICLCLVVLCGAAALEIFRLGGPVGGFPSFLALTAFAFSVLAALGLTLAALAPGRWWDRLFAALRLIRARLTAATIPCDRRCAVVLAVYAAISYLILVVVYFPLQPGPEGNDQGAYLETAVAVDEEGGVPALIEDLFGGEFTEANRHPLYIALLSFAPRYEAGKVLSAIIGGVSLLALGYGVARRFGPLAGGVFSVLLATNAAFLRFSTLVASEGLLTLLGGVAWLVLVGWARGGRVSGGVGGGAVPGNLVSSGKCAQGTLEEPPLSPLRKGGSHGQAASMLQIACAGAALGLAWLTKGTGLLLLGGTVLWMFVIGVRDWRSSRSAGRMAVSVLVLVLAWSAVASPLLVRNVRRYGTPFYNVNSWLLFVDEYEDPVRLASEKSVGEAAREYVQSHSVAEMARRAVTGLAWETFTLVRSLGPPPLDDSRVLFGGLFLLLAAAGLMAEQREAVLLLLVWTAISLAMFGWYVPIAAGERFILPLILPLLAYASDGLVRGLAVIGTGVERLPRRVGWALAVWSGLWLWASFFVASPVIEAAARPELQRADEMSAEVPGDTITASALPQARFVTW